MAQARAGLAQLLLRRLALHPILPGGPAMVCPGLSRPSLHHGHWEPHPVALLREHAMSSHAQPSQNITAASRRLGFPQSHPGADFRYAVERGVLPNHHYVLFRLRPVSPSCVVTLGSTSHRCVHSACMLPHTPFHSGFMAAQAQHFPGKHAHCRRAFRYFNQAGPDDTHICIRLTRCPGAGFLIQGWRDNRNQPVPHPFVPMPTRHH